MSQYWTRFSCHPEERSDEGSAVGAVEEKQILRFAQDDKRKQILRFAQDDSGGYGTIKALIAARDSTAASASAACASPYRPLTISSHGTRSPKCAASCTARWK